jgi:hypothetical protein
VFDSANETFGEVREGGGLECGGRWRWIGGGAESGEAGDVWEGMMNR